MSLKKKKSLYDRHQIGILGPTVERPDGEGPNPSNGNFFTDSGNSDSPFQSKGGDHMVALLNQTVASPNSSQTYPPSDLDFIEKFLTKPKYPS